jgi:uncharacterized SAM-binding protein YcdF (DUF218 family)
MGSPGTFCVLTPTAGMRYVLPLAMKKSASTMSIVLWVIGGLVSAYIIGGVLLYFDLRSGAMMISDALAPILHFVSDIYTPVFGTLWKIWPALFPFYS